jgi:hypothetical protein
MPYFITAVVGLLNNQIKHKILLLVEASIGIEWPVKVSKDLMVFKVHRAHRVLLELKVLKVHRVHRVHKVLKVNKVFKVQDFYGKAFGVG